MYKEEITYCCSLDIVRRVCSLKTKWDFFFLNTGKSFVKAKRLTTCKHSLNDFLICGFTERRVEF